ncbi:MAG: hypothetical protein P8Y70_05240 [Candidatus Lokiarchaeota archaeon]
MIKTCPECKKVLNAEFIICPNCYHSLDNTLLPENDRKLLEKELKSIKYDKDATILGLFIVPVFFIYMMFITLPFFIFIAVLAIPIEILLIFNLFKYFNKEQNLIKKSPT